jgi:competence protein ComEA
VIVHVAGAVNAAGVYSLPAGSRVDDAVAAAGGSTSAADPDALNLAATLTDGSRVYVPLVGEVVAVEAIDTTAPATGPLDVNRASASELDTLPGIGPATATAIVTERDRNGPFASVADLERVPGIGPAKLAALSDLVST